MMMIQPPNLPLAQAIADSVVVASRPPEGHRDDVSRAADFAAQSKEGEAISTTLRRLLRRAMPSSQRHVERHIAYCVLVTLTKDLQRNFGGLFGFLAGITRFPIRDHLDSCEETLGFLTANAAFPIKKHYDPCKETLRFLQGNIALRVKKYSVFYKEITTSLAAIDPIPYRN